MTVSVAEKSALIAIPERLGCRICLEFRNDQICVRSACAW